MNIEKISVETKIGLGQKFIFFLQLTPELPASFYALTDHLSEWNLVLVPVNLKEFLKLEHTGKEHLIAVTNGFTALRTMRMFRKKFLDFALKSNKFCLYDLSSFGEISISNKLHRLKNYKHFRLPIDANLICKSIARNYYRNRGTDQRWPGGKRATLPAMN